MQTTIETKLRVKQGTQPYYDDRNIYVRTEGDDVYLKLGRQFDLEMQREDAGDLSDHLGNLLKKPAGWGNNISDLFCDDAYIRRQSKACLLQLLVDVEWVAFSIPQGAVRRLARVLNDIGDNSHD
jgi:hypothetical protein